MFNYTMLNSVDIAGNRRNSQRGWFISI